MKAEEERRQLEGRLQAEALRQQMDELKQKEMEVRRPVLADPATPGAWDWRDSNGHCEEVTAGWGYCDPDPACPHSRFCWDAPQCSSDFGTLCSKTYLSTR